MKNPACVLAAAGDIVIRRRLFGGQDFDRGYEQTNAWLREGDLIWGSCEVQFSNRGYRSDAPIAYRVDAEVARDLGRAGFNLMTVATNHTCDFGEPAFLDTLDNLTKAGITAVGGGKDLSQAMAPVIREVHGLRVGVLAVSCLVPPDYAATSDRPGIAPVRIEQSVDFNPLFMLIEPGAPLRVRSRANDQDQARLTDAVTALRKEVDFVMVSVHWGYGKGEVLAEYQQPLAHAIIDAGADLIMGNHTHSPGALEVYEGKPIIYSLGNHIAQQAWDEATPLQKEIYATIDPWSVVAQCILRPHHVEEIRFRATRCDRVIGLPTLVNDPAEAFPVLERLQRISTQFGTSMVIEGAQARALFPHAA